MAYIISPVAGASLTETSTDKKFALGTVVNLNDGGQAVYVSAGSTVSTAAVVVIDQNFGVLPITTTNSATSKSIGAAQTSIASGYFGWVQTSGRPRIKVLANCSDNVPLYTTATAGELDDTVVSTGLIAGVTLPTRATSVSNATAVTCIMAIGAMVLTGDAD